MFHQVEGRGLRLFFALPLPEGLAAALEGWRQGYPGIEGWCASADLHLTLAFLGHRPPLILPGLEALGASVAARHRIFSLQTAALGSFSKHPTTRLLWLGLDPARALEALAEDLRRALLAAGESLDTRPFHPHLTLARFKQAQPFAAFADPPARAFAADRLVLFESRPRGHHTPLGTWPLRGV
ncbi:hypothetical protein GETHLI_16070 [Geothrix limicola]|uniref:RNA 2',3'-cyclic phosphodiesterase n=1 Tax=Geothrix limicola TaxID=2927978 RepID=A0ABQ5QE30_9BACT|nr:RNA 2',3'-cyclic phosphodiesterase [Geothrix limicola]GLH73105.1 hypothetical protein GETHLI_16070 [Geothrix limicola]